MIHTAPTTATPHETERLFQQAVAAHLSGDTDTAQKRYRAVLAMTPDHASALNNLATILAAKGDSAAACQLLLHAVRVDPGYGEALNNLGVLYHEQGDFASAMDCLTRATTIDPANADWLNHLGNVCVELARYADAEQAYGRATALRPDQPHYWSNRGIALRGLRRPAEAIQAFERALAIDPRHVNALSNMGVVLKEERRFDEAITTFERAIALEPTNASLVANYASIFEPMGRYDRVRELAQRAIAIDPAYAESYNLLANAEMEDGRYDEALALYEQALARDPQNRNANWNVALILLLRGDFTRGWAQFEWRKRLQSVLIDAAHYDGPEWDGSPLAGRTILLHTEQGIGDAIQFARYATVLRKHGAGRVVVECPYPIVPLLRTVPGVDDAVARGTSLPAYDVHANLMSLPGLVGTTLDTIPCDIPYLRAEPRPVASMITAPNGELTVGIVWAGNPAHQRDFLRSIPLERLRSLFDLSGVRFFSLQKGEKASAELRSLDDDRIVDLAPYLDDFRDTAAAVAKLDLVLTVDTSVAHLAGALGRPTWIMITHVPDFRWMLERRDSPWYPSVRLFRQPRPREWDAVIRDVAAALRGRIAAHQAPAVSTGPATQVAEAVVTLDAATRLADGRPRFDLWIPLARLADPEWFAAYQAELVDDGHAMALRDFWDEAAAAVDVVVQLEPRVGIVTLAIATGPKAPRCIVVVEPDAGNADRLRDIARARNLDHRVSVVADATEAIDTLRQRAPSTGAAQRIGVHAATARAAHAFALALGDAGVAGIEVVTAESASTEDAGVALTSLTVVRRDGRIELDPAVEEGAYTNAVWLSDAAIARLATEPDGPAQVAPDHRIATTTAAGATEIGIDWELRSDTGWGIYGVNLAQYLRRHADVCPTILEPRDEGLPPLARWELREALHRGATRRAELANGHRGRFNGLLLRALGNGLIGAPWSSEIAAGRRAGMVFFEDTCMDHDVLARGRAFDIIVAGSTWNAEVLRAHGLNVACVLQGIDPTVFHPAPRSGRFNGRFVVFSGGKLEYRKGQDLVIAAFRRFRERHPDALLITAWHNAWPQLITDLDLAGHVRGLPIAPDGRLDIPRWLEANGIDPRDVVDIGAVPNAVMGTIVREADVALFPNRCEGGTNLVAMECMAAGVPTIVSANTGHRDLVATGACVGLERQRPVAPPTRFFRATEGWGESDVDEMVDALERLYDDRAAAAALGAHSARVMQDWTWERQVARLLDVLRPYFPTTR